LVIYSRQYNGVKARFTRVTMFISTILNGDIRNENNIAVK